MVAYWQRRPDCRDLDRQAWMSTAIASCQTRKQTPRQERPQVPITSCSCMRPAIADSRVLRTSMCEQVQQVCHCTPGDFGIHPSMR